MNLYTGILQHFEKINQVDFVLEQLKRLFKKEEKLRKWVHFSTKLA